MNNNSYLVRLIDKYQCIDNFVKQYNKINYLEFDNNIVKNFTLFNLDSEVNFEKISKVIELVLASLSAIKYVFNKGIRILKEENLTLPIEVVRIVNKETINHIAMHSELWESLNSDGIKPKKLLTQIYDDYYSIYENIVFADAVSKILKFLNRSRYHLLELIYTSKKIELNLLERLNHLNYFLSLGKIHTSYIKNFDIYYKKATILLDNISKIKSIINPKLNLPIYKENLKKIGKIKLKKTTIFTIQKTYKKIYLLAKSLSEVLKEDDVKISSAKINHLSENYLVFSKIMILFAALQFDFTPSKDSIIDYHNLDITLTFKTWEMRIYQETYKNKKIIVVEISKEEIYKIIFYPSVSYEVEELDINASEIVYLTPLNITNTIDIKQIDISSIESFRRIEQVILRAMIYCSTKNDICPFCGESLEKVVEDSQIHYHCNVCQSLIFNTTCKYCNNPYIYTKINKQKSSLDIKKYDKQDIWRYKKEKEAIMYFRNITDVTDDLDIICPHCHHVNKGN